MIYYKFSCLYFTADNPQRLGRVVEDVWLYRSIIDRSRRQEQTGTCTSLPPQCDFISWVYHGPERDNTNLDQYFPYHRKLQYQLVNPLPIEILRHQIGYADTQVCDKHVAFS